MSEVQKYTIALLPDEKTMVELQKVIDDLAAKHGTVTFEPHLTFVGSLELPAQAVIAVAEQIAPKLQSLQLSFLSVEFSTTYWRCIYAIVKSDPILMAAHLEARAALGLSDDYFGFIPHVSLMYATFGMAETAQICREIQLENMNWQAKKLVVYKDSPDPTQWTHLAKFDL